MTISKYTYESRSRCTNQVPIPKRFDKQITLALVVTDWKNDEQVSVRVFRELDADALDKLPKDINTSIRLVRQDVSAMLGGADNDRA